MYKFISRLVYFIITIVLTTCLFSCVSVKDLKYFQDISDSTKQHAKIKLPSYTAPVFHKGDYVTVTLYTVDPAVSASFNNAGTAAGANVAGADQNGYVVDANGEIELPQLGKVKLENLTLEQAQVIVTAMAKVKFVNPTIVIRPKGLKITVLGEVTRPGIFYIPLEKANLIDAIGTAGDLTAFAKKDNVLLMRTNEITNVLEPVTLNLKSTDVIKSPYFYLKNNDVLIVEPSNNKAIANDVVFSRNLTLITVGLSVLTTLLLVFKK